MYLEIETEVSPTFDEARRGGNGVRSLYGDSDTCRQSGDWVGD